MMIPSNVKFLNLYPKRREAKSWDNIGAFRYVRSQLTVEIFLTPDHTGRVHSALVTRVSSHPLEDTQVSVCGGFRRL